MMTKMSQQDLNSLIDTAIDRGRQAGRDAMPTPMHVAGFPPIADGVCGFAWVHVKPATCQVAKELVKRGLACTSVYDGGVKVWINDYNQSMQKKEAHAQAFAAVLIGAGVRAHAGSRMD